MSNSIINHVNPTNINRNNNLKGSKSDSNSITTSTTTASSKKSSSIMLMEILRNDPGVTQLYGPIYKTLELIRKKIKSNQSS